MYHHCDFLFSVPALDELRPDGHHTGYKSATLFVNANAGAHGYSSHDAHDGSTHTAASHADGGAGAQNGAVRPCLPRDA